MRHHVRAGISWGCWRSSRSRRILSTRSASIPNAPLAFGAVPLSFPATAPLSLAGEGWPSMQGTWTVNGSEMELRLTGAPSECAGAARYTIAVNDQHITFTLLSDACVERRMILDRSEWRPASEAIVVPERRIGVRAPGAHELPRAMAVTGVGPRFAARKPPVSPKASDSPTRGTRDRQEHPVAPAIPGLAHSSPIVWGDTVFVTSAISSRKDATFKPGLYGDGDASDDRSRHAGCSTHRQAHGKNALGAHRARRRAAQQAAHQIDLRQRQPRHRRANRRRVVRIPRYPRVRRQWRACYGRWISGASTWAPTTSRHTSGDRPARQSSGTDWSSCSATRRRTRSCSR